MIKSMTGYGRAREVRNKRDITVEVRSVNNRYLDCTVKMPRMYSFAEDAVKQCVQKAISRGKVDVFITVDASAADVAKVTVNRELAAQYAAALAELSEVCGTESKVTPEQLSRFPDVLTVTKEDEDLETVSADLCAVAEQALEAYNAMRAVEGRKLAEDIGNRLTYIENYTSQVEQRSPETVTEYRAKLTARMEEVLQCTTIDPQRILQEAAIYAAVGVLGFAMACVFATFYAVATKAVPENANEVAGLMIMAISAGAVSGPVCGAIVRAWGNPHLGMLFVAACVAYMLWASIQLKMKN